MIKTFWKTLELLDNYDRTHRTVENEWASYLYFRKNFFGYKNYL